MSDLSYPIGKFHFEGSLSDDQKQKLVDDISRAPANLRAAVSGLSPAQLDTPYRPGGWTVRQVTHHVPDSHMNAYIRFKLALTESEPTIKPYEQQLWAELADTRSTPIEVSLTLLDSLHDRWVRLLRSVKPEDWKRTFDIPSSERSVWRRIWRFMPGMASIMWPTSPTCAGAMDGKLLI